MPKAPSKTPDFGWKGTMQTDYLGVSLMHFGEMHGTRRTRARCGLRPHEIRFECGRKRGQDRFVTDSDAALGHHFRDVPVAERKSKIKPSAMTDDQSGKAVTAVRQRLDGRHVHSAIEHEGR